MHARLALAFALLLSGTALADPSISEQRAVMGPSGVTGSAGQFGSASCDRLTVLSPGFCDTGGMGAIIDVQGLNDAHAHGHHFAVGTCRVDQHVIPALFWSFVCGTDRDDDGLVTNADDSSSDPDGYDDDFTPVHPGFTTASFCFRRDTASALHDWDRWSVFILANQGDPPARGSFNVVVEATAAGGCEGGNVSGHCHGNYYGSHASGSSGSSLVETSTLAITDRC